MHTHTATTLWGIYAGLIALLLLLGLPGWCQTVVPPAPTSPAGEAVPPPPSPPLVAPPATAVPGAAPPMTLILPPTPPPAPPEEEVVTDPFTMELPLFGLSLFQREGTETQPTQAAPVSPAYVLGPGDVLNVRLWTGTVLQVTAEVPVDNEGIVAIDNVGRIGVQGLSLGAVQAMLQQRYGRLYRDFTLEVSLATMRTVEVFVIGEVALPGKYSLPGTATVFTALFAAGGPTEMGSLRNLRVTRADQSLQTLDLYDYLLEGRRVADLPLQPGDTVFVPLVGPRVGVAGAVKRPAEYELKGGQSLSQVLEMAGGLRPRAYAPRVQVRRFAGNRSYETQEVDLAEPGMATAFLMQDGDRVVAEEVTDLVANAVTLEGPVYRPGVYQLRPGLTVGRLLREAEGLTPEAYGQWAILQRVNPATAQYEDRALNPLLAMQQEAEHDLPLQARDRLIIYGREEIEGAVTVAVEGEVRQEGDVAYSPGMTVRDAVLRAGGLKPGAYTSRAQLVRVRPDMTREVLAVNLEKAMAGDAAENLTLRPQDWLVVASRAEVGAAPVVTVGGQVRNPGEYPRYENMKVSDLLALAGGVLPGANGVVEVTHGRYTEVPTSETVRIAVGPSTPEVTPDLLLGDDDFVAVMGAAAYVQAPAKVEVLGEVANPGPYVLRHPTSQPESVWDVLQRAGGTLASAYGPGVVVYRRPENMVATRSLEQYQHVIMGIDQTQREIKLETATRAPAGGPPIAGAAAPALPGARQPATPAPTSESPAALSPGVTPASSSIATGAVLTPAGGVATPAAPAPAGAPAPAAPAVPAAPPTAGTGAAPSPTSQMNQVTLGLAQVFSTQNAVTVVLPPRELAMTTFAKAIPVDWARLQATQGREGDVVLRDGDVVYVPTQPGLVMVAGAVRNQGPVRYEPGLTVGRALDLAGGLGKDAVLRQTIVIRLNGETKPVGSREKVEPGDILIVPTQYILQTARAQSGVERILSALASVAVAFRFLF